MLIVIARNKQTNACNCARHLSVRHPTWSSPAYITMEWITENYRELPSELPSVEKWKKGGEITRTDSPMSVLQLPLMAVIFPKCVPVSNILCNGVVLHTVYVHSFGTYPWCVSSFSENPQSF